MFYSRQTRLVLIKEGLHTVQSKQTHLSKCSLLFDIQDLMSL